MSQANHKLDESARGVFVISATPFREDCALDLDGIDRLVEFYLDAGVHGITILGMMGEAPKLLPEESVAFVQRVLARVAGRVPVIVGVSNPGTDNLVTLARVSMDAGAAGVMVAPLPTLRQDEQVMAYYEAVCERLGSEVPVCYQDYPQSTQVFVSVGLLLRMVEALPQLVMLKHEDCPGLGKLGRIRARSESSSTRRISILCGNGGLYLPLELARGADGAMTGFGYPEMLVEVYERFIAGDREGAEDVFDAYLPVVRYEQQPGFGLAVRKEILRRRGAITSATTRSPGPRLDGDDMRELDALLARLERRLRS
jgi:4-hydroxy-tetrahydrodipicolinate synthase